MSVFTALNKLKTNIFGGPGNTGFTKPPASRVQDIGLTPSPTGLLNEDPLAPATFSYPLDVQTNFQNGHYMLFYVNVQNKTKYSYKSPSGVNIGDYKQYEYADADGNITTYDSTGANLGEIDCLHLFSFYLSRRFQVYYYHQFVYLLIVVFSFDTLSHQH